MTSITAAATFNISPKQLAEAFWELEAMEQAEFFSRLIEVAGSLNLDNQMYQVGNYAHSLSSLEGDNCVSAMKIVGRNGDY